MSKLWVNKAYIKRSTANKDSSCHMPIMQTVLWRKIGLSVSEAKKDKVGKFITGLSILSFSNICLILYASAPLFMKYALGENNALLLWWGAVFVIPLYAILCFVGLIMVYTAKHNK